MINITHIYFIHKGDSIPCYVGKTTNLHSRLAGHKNTKPQYTHIELIDSIPSSEWKFWEEYYINLFYSWGFNLENKTRKGRGCGERPCTWADRISKSLKGKIPKWSEQEKIDRKNRLKNKKFALGYKYTEQQKENCTIGKRRIYYQYDKEGNLVKEWYATKQEIALFFNKDSSNLTHHLNGRQKSAYGFIWKPKE
jgi:hypothetical protein